MRIEKINENRIRCTLSRADLEDREIKLSELAYGTDKAKTLFRDMMTEASRQFGFEADNIPLMIEAIPLSPDCIVLDITKVEDPEELDTRFSKFSQSDFEDIESLEDDSLPDAIPGADEIYHLLQEIKKEFEDKLPRRPAAEQAGTDSEDSRAADILMTYSFDELDHVLDAASMVKSLFSGNNTLYQDPASGHYILTLYRSGTDAVLFNRVCNILSQYGKREHSTYASDCYFKEHYTHVLDMPIQSLA